MDVFFGLARLRRAMEKVKAAAAEWTPSAVDAAKRKESASAARWGAWMAKRKMRRSAMALALAGNAWQICSMAIVLAMLSPFLCAGSACAIVGMGLEWAAMRWSWRLPMAVIAVAAAALDAWMEWTFALFKPIVYALGCVGGWCVGAAGRAWALERSLAPRSSWLFALGVNPLCMCNSPDLDDVKLNGKAWPCGGLSRLRRLGLEGAAEPDFAAWADKPVGLLGLSVPCWPWESALTAIGRSLAKGNGPLGEGTEEELAWLARAAALAEARQLGQAAPKPWL